jgi:hypothetical protein
LPVFFGLPPGTAANELSVAALAGDPLAAAKAAQQFQAAPLSVAGVDRAGPRGVIYGALPPGSWVLKNASRPMTASVGALGGTLWHPSPASAAGSASRRAASSQTASHVLSGNGGQVPPAVLEPAGATGQHLAALATILLWSACLVALLRRRRTGPDSGTEAVPLHSDAGPVGDELVLVGEER